MSGEEELRELAAWEPPLGVASVYLELDPGDRGDGWRTRLRNGLERLRGAAGEAGHERKLALRATADRLAARFEAAEPPYPRAVAGFVEVAARHGRERWHDFHLVPRTAAAVALEPGPVLAPLLDLARRSRRRAVALVSAERVRLLDWAPGEATELTDWELSLFSDDWRERKARRPADPAGAQGVSASGRDQFGQRLEANRERFLAECGARAGRRAAGLGLEEMLGFGPGIDLERFRAGIRDGPPRFLAGAERDLIALPTGELEEPVAAAAERAEEERGRELAERALDAARAGGRGSAGAEETAQALEEGRVEHLLLECGGEGYGLDVERPVRRALATDAAVTCLPAGLDGLLAGSGGVAAILRY